MIDRNYHANKTCCLKCNAVYIPRGNMNQIEYWNCSSCNMKETKQIVALAGTHEEIGGRTIIRKRKRKLHIVQRNYAFC